MSELMRKGEKYNMFEKLFGKKKVSPYINEVFGEMGYVPAMWEATEKAKITLWNKSYDIRLCVIARDKNDCINTVQENAYKDYISTKQLRQKQVEELIKDYFGTNDEAVLSAKFLPERLIFGKNGEYGLCGDNSDEDWEEYHDVPFGLCVIFSPKLEITTEEDFLADVIVGR